MAGCEIVHNGRSSWTLKAVDMSTLPLKAGWTADSHTSHMTAMTMTHSTCIPSSDPTTTCHTGCQEQPTSQMQEAAQSLAHFSHCWAGAEWGLSPDHDLSILQLCSEARRPPGDPCSSSCCSDAVVSFTDLHVLPALGYRSLFKHSKRPKGPPSALLSRTLKPDPTKGQTQPL